MKFIIKNLIQNKIKMGNVNCCSPDANCIGMNQMPVEHIASEKKEQTYGAPTRTDVENSVILWIKFTVVYGEIPDVHDAESYREHMAGGVCNLWASLPGLINKHFIFND